MEKSLTTIEQDEYIIIFYDKSTQKITEAQQDALLKASTTDRKFIKVNGNVINFGGINKILPLVEYYREYPNEAPEQRNMFEAESIEELSIRDLWESNIKRAEGIREGLLKNIKENDTQTKRDMLAEVDKKISELSTGKLDT